MIWLAKLVHYMRPGTISCEEAKHPKPKKQNADKFQRLRERLYFLNGQKNGILKKRSDFEIVFYRVKQETGFSFKYHTVMLMPLFDIFEGEAPCALEENGMILRKLVFTAQESVTDHSSWKIAHYSSTYLTRRRH
ncbi:hypothetical protein [Paenibacillus nasutitermitis]|uniref:Uncharacterized protein n=1 Tax=Paenibacillus nasutitermitis TaxID=1652958 RepID=A0A917E113_9BACL|nr:hypothetical protein [Paenibacillus nasutitermitis]GGD87671.1 hypothetical protein GCM10010911_52650 [Paenibacillus nasutitermitis]